MTLEQVVAHLAQQVDSRFYGKYRGLVVDNADPEQLGRLKLRVPSVLGNDVVTGWAMPCVPYGGDVNQGFLCIPEVGAGVWVEFEEGDLEFPIWVGTFWSKPGGDSELPKPNDPDGAEQSGVQDPPSRKILKTLKGHTIQLEDKDGEESVLIVEAVNNNVIIMDQNGIKITEGPQGHEVVLDANGIQIRDAANGHVIVMDSSGVTVTDGTNGNTATMAASGVTLEDANGNQILMGASGIKIGSNAAVEPFVLGNQLKLEVANFLIALSTHTHVGNMGAPTSPPTSPMNLNVPTSTKHMVE